MPTSAEVAICSIVVDSKRVASSFPIHVEIEGVPGAEKTKWDSIASHDPFMAPMFAAMAIGSAIENTTAERGEVTWKAHTVGKVAGYGALELLPKMACARKSTCETFTIRPMTSEYWSPTRWLM